jgi:adhesin transport system outer membrane protein
MGTLLAALNLRRIETPSPDEMGEDPFEVDPATACPPQTPVTLAVDKPAAVARIAALNPLPQPAPPPVIKPVAVSDEAQIRKAINDWITAWAKKNVEAYLAFYSSGFAPAGGGARESWVKQRSQRLAQPGTIELTIENLNVRLTGVDAAVSEFRQTYRSDAYQDVVSKTLHWRREGGHWMITQETSGK